MMKKCLLLFTALCFMTLMSDLPPAYRVKCQAARVENFDFDNGIDHPAWQNQKQYDFLRLIKEKQDINLSPIEPGSVKFLYDDKYFYVRAEFYDSDIMTTAAKDGGHFYTQGDLVEVFLKPNDANYYWEIYGTPNKLNTRFYFTSRSTVGLPSGFTHQEIGTKVSAKITGTLNNPEDRDEKVIILLAIPLVELNRPHITKDHPANTVAFAPGNTWRILVARYNYSRYLNTNELSCFPQMLSSYHALEYFAELELIK